MVAHFVIFCFVVCIVKSFFRPSVSGNTLPLLPTHHLERLQKSTVNPNRPKYQPAKYSYFILPFSPVRMCGCVCAFRVPRKLTLQTTSEIQFPHIRSCGSPVNAARESPPANIVAHPGRFHACTAHSVCSVVSPNLLGRKRM